MIPPEENTPYNANIPRVNDDLASTQPNFLNNFFQMNEAFRRNHSALDAGAPTEGNHSIVEMLHQNGSFQTDVSELSVYAKTSEGQTDQLFLRYQGNGTEVQITNYQIYGPVQLPGQSIYMTFLPGKLLVLFGAFFPPNLPDGKTIQLSPFIMKNIMALNVCGSDFVGRLLPTYKVIQNLPGINTSIQFFQLSPIGYFYLCVGNI
jgi:hypothetical protein